MTSMLFMVVVLVATFLFWAVGAHNRLVRLRSEVGKAFVALDAVLSVQPALIQSALPADLAPELSPDGSLARWSQLSSSGEQYARSLAKARAHPLDPEAISALCTAQRVLDDVLRGAAKPPDDEDSTDTFLSDSLSIRFARLADQAEGPREVFDASVSAYNHAVRQFPAMLLARIWGFKPACAIQTPIPE